MVSRLLSFLVASVLGFLVSVFRGGEGRGGRKKRNDEGERTSGKMQGKKERKEREERRRGRRLTSLQKCRIWGSRMHPKRIQNGSLEASGRPLTSLGGPRRDSLVLNSRELGYLSLI